LFASATSENQIFKDALQKGFAGEPDRLTLERLQVFKLSSDRSAAAEAPKRDGYR
jgi:hypothetical protein